MKNYSFFAFLMISTFVCADPIVIPSKAIRYPMALGEISLEYDADDFKLTANGKTSLVQQYNIDKEMRNMDLAALSSLVDNGYIRVTKNTADEYILRPKGRLNGGGPVCGAIAYFTTKAICYVGIGLVVEKIKARVHKRRRCNLQSMDPGAMKATVQLGVKVVEGMEVTAKVGFDTALANSGGLPGVPIAVATKAVDTYLPEAMSGYTGKSVPESRADLHSAAETAVTVIAIEGAATAGSVGIIETIATSVGTFVASITPF